MSGTDQPYKGYLSRLYDRVAPTYDHLGPRFFSHFGRRLIERSGLHHGASVLDVGCGRGACLLPAAERLGSSGKIVGVDLSAAMVEWTAREIKHLGLANAKARQMDAEALGLPDSSFDFVYCGFVLFLLPDLDRILAEILRVLRPGGLFSTSTFGRGMDRRWDAYRRLVRSYRTHLRPNPYAAAPTLFDAAELRVILSRAGFANVEVLAKEQEFHYQGAEEWWAAEWSCGNRALFECLEPAVLEQFKVEALETVRDLQEEDGIPLRLRVLLARAGKP